VTRRGGKNFGKIGTVASETKVMRPYRTVMSLEKRLGSKRKRKRNYQAGAV